MARGPGSEDEQGATQLLKSTAVEIIGDPDQEGIAQIERVREVKESSKKEEKGRVQTNEVLSKEKDDRGEINVDEGTGGIKEAGASVSKDFRF